MSRSEGRTASPMHRTLLLGIIVVILGISYHHPCGSSFQLQTPLRNVAYWKIQQKQQFRVLDRACRARTAAGPVPSTTSLHLLDARNRGGPKERNDEKNSARAASNDNDSESNNNGSSNSRNRNSNQPWTSKGTGEKYTNDGSTTRGETPLTVADAANDDDDSVMKIGTGVEDPRSSFQSEQEKDFSMWVEGLKLWPRYPGTSWSTTTSKASSDPLQVDTNLQRRPTDGARERADGSGGGSNDSSVNGVGDAEGGDGLRIKTVSSANSGSSGIKNAAPSSSSSSFPSALFSAIPSLMKDDASIASTMSASEKNMLISALESSSGRYKGINPLSNFIKFEAILDMAAGVNNETEPYFSNVVAAAEQLLKLTVIKNDDEEQRDTQRRSAAEKGSDTERDVAFDKELVDDLLSKATTVEELIERERYFGSLPFRLDNFPRKSTPANAARSNKARDESKRPASPLSVPSLSSSAASDIDSLLPVTDATSSQAGLAQAAESMLKDATSRIEFLVSEASNAFSPSSVQELVIRASKVFAASPNGTDASYVVETVSNEVVEAARRVARDRGLDVQFAADRAREATDFAASMAAVANSVLGAGYAYGTRSGASGIEGYPLGGVLPQIQQGTARPLFGDYASARRVEPYQYESTVIKGAEMGALAGAIYENALERCHTMGHSQVANGTTANVAWMVTDTLDYKSRYFVETSKEGQKPFMVRTITIRGFDASDESVDREQLLNDICTATSEPLDTSISNAFFHKGLLSIARRVYADIKKYIDWTAPDHRIVLNGHSVGGSLSVLILLLIASERGAGYVSEKILRVYTHGSPPVATINVDAPLNTTTKNSSRLNEETKCSILQAFGLPATIVFGYIQPYDPVTRLFSEYDALYPLVDDLGADEVTLYATGPRRSLRPIARAIFQAWSGWPRFRGNWKGTSNQRYQSVGVQHILLPEPLRYLNDRFLSTNVGVPPIEALVRISPEELLPALEEMFPLDAFQISLIPQAVRSFLHHFYPAYDAAIVTYASKVEKQTQLS